MRRLAKHTIPTVLAENAAAWLAEFIADPESKTKRFRYRHQDIKLALRRETGWKCVYCESKIGHNTPGDVEHKVPTSKDQTQHFTWENLTIACTECNSRKNDYYAVGDAFLDPYVDDVEAWLVHLGPIVHWAPGKARAEAAVRKLKLDSLEGRAALLDRKREVLEKARAILETIEAAKGNALLEALRKDELNKMCDQSAEYSAMVKTYVNAVSGRDGAVSPPPA